MNQLEHRSKDSAAGVGLGRDATRHHKDPIELGWGRARSDHGWATMKTSCSYCSVAAHFVCTRLCSLGLGSGAAG